ncbi:MAG: MBL fold metallo-hydrolase [bacterium]
MRRLFSIEGNAQRLDGGAMFGNAPRELWQSWSPPDERHRVPLACRGLLVAEEHRTILFETGVGAFFEPRLRDRFGVVGGEHRLLASLRAVGAAPEDVDVVVLSHLHFDHAGGLLAAWEQDRPPRLVFPKARYVTSEAAFRRAEAPHPRDRASFIPELQPLLAATGRLELLREDRSTVLGPRYSFHFSEGHTPGLALAELATGEGPLVFVADLAPGRPWVHAAITMGYDRFPERAVDEKLTLFADLVERGGRLFFTHDPEVALARLARDGRGRFGTTDERATVAGDDC